MVASPTTIRMTFAALGLLVVTSWGFAWDLRSRVATSEQVAVVEAKADAAATRGDLKELALRVEASASKDDLDALTKRMEDRFHDIQQTSEEFMRAETGKAMNDTLRAESKGRSDVTDAKLDSLISAVDSLTRRADLGKP